MSQPYFTPLSPLSHLDRASLVFPHRPAVLDGDLELSYHDLSQRVRRLAGMLRGVGVAPGDRVAVLSPNTHVLLESHFGVAGAGGVLVAINTRLAAAEIAAILRHSQASVLIYDRALAELAVDAVGRAEFAGVALDCGSVTSGYDRRLAEADPYWQLPTDELALLSINYTSGTTGAPKGVMYHHRGAFLQSLAMAYHAGLTTESVYLWTLPMFHTNGWCFPWAVTLAGARHICLRAIDPEAIWGLLEEHGVTHLCAAPTVLIMLADARARHRLSRPLNVMTGGAPPTPALIERLGELNVRLVHLYGLTETFGPAAICQWQPEWHDLTPPERAELLARQGVGNVISDRVRVVDGDGRDVAADGAQLGEIAIRGNNLMLGYFQEPQLTAEAVPDGWFRTGDLAVMHPSGYVEIRDRRKDMIISGGENISSVEVERVLASHPDVLEVAVVGVPDPKWGEVPVAVVESRAGAAPSAEDLVVHVRSRLAGFKVPRQVRFAPLPRTSTGKVRKDLVRRLVAEPESGEQP